jgi:hypothetical protein
MPAFARHVGIDYSGAETPTSGLKGLRVYLADGDALPVEVPPPPSAKKYWTRRGIAKWLSRADGDGTLVPLLNPYLSPPERTLAQIEGWILGVDDAKMESGPSCIKGAIHVRN